MSRAAGTPLSRTGTGAREASAFSAASSPRSLSTVGWRPPASSRSSLIASWASSRACATSGIALAGSVCEPRLGEAQGQCEGDQALLRAVVEVALDAPALRVGGVDDALPGVAQVIDALAQSPRALVIGGLAREADLAHLKCSVAAQADRPRFHSGVV